MKDQALVAIIKLLLTKDPEKRLRSITAPDTFEVTLLQRPCFSPCKRPQVSQVTERKSGPELEEAIKVVEVLKAQVSASSQSILKMIRQKITEMESDEEEDLTSDSQVQDDETFSVSAGNHSSSEASILTVGLLCGALRQNQT